MHYPTNFSYRILSQPVLDLLKNCKKGHTKLLVKASILLVWQNYHTKEYFVQWAQKHISDSFEFFCDKKNH